VDGATLRRGKPVAHSIWGNSTAVLVGDFLLARALSIAAETGIPKVIKIIAEITENMSQGEIHQLMRKGNVELTQEEYMEIIRRKTAVLFQGACRISALIACAPEEKESALSEYGFNLGLSFQMADDLLDYTSDATVLGKPVGADLKEGKLTLPVIHSLANATVDDKKQMEGIIADTNFSEDEFNRLVELLEKYDGISYTKKLAAKHIETAKNALSIFELSTTKNILLDVANYTLSRKF
jgi:octaprenyl-diphosphate synthase